jgi:dTDP-4-dehydrorhamnose 3,5-epimerase
MKVIETNLKDCFILEPKIFGDERGYFFEVFNEKVFQEKTGLTVSFVQDNQSSSKRGVLRGLHMQKGKHAQAKLVRVIKGKVLDVVVDVRENSATFGKTFSCVLSEENKKQLYIPRGFLHGFAVLEDDTIFAYKCDNYYNPEAEDGVIYNDKDLQIDWMLSKDEIILSNKDEKLKPFNEFILNYNNKEKTILTYGTFDLLHYGHLEILQRSRKLGSKLIVGLSTDEFNIKKGKDCKIPFEKRKELLSSIDFVNEIIPESNWEQKIDDIKKYNVDVFVMGDDWQGKFDDLNKYCEVIYLPRTIDISTSKLKKVMQDK